MLSTRAFGVFFASLAFSTAVLAQPQNNRPTGIVTGDAVISGFSGTLFSSARPSSVENQFINPDEPSTRVLDVGRPGRIWEGQVIATQVKYETFARDTGQIFGVAVTDQPNPDIFLSATSAYGLHLTGRNSRGETERRKKGGPGVGWMRGQFGLDLQGGPGSIYKIDGRTGSVSLFANIMLENVPNHGPGLGNIAYDNANRQLFVSDLATGMIHRLATDGRELEIFDHGLNARPAARLAPVTFDPRMRASIAREQFDSENPATWGFAPPARRVFAVTLHQGRLFYSVAENAQIWSIGLTQNGAFANDPRWELNVVGATADINVTDIAFSEKGAMILAERAAPSGSFAYTNLVKAGESRVLRFWPKQPNDPSPGLWTPQAEEYAVGFAGQYRNTNGGIALGYGYDRNGNLATNSCQGALWTTAQNIRNAPALRDRLTPGGPLAISGLHGMPSEPARPFNEPPFTSYSVDYDGQLDQASTSGHMGSVRIYTTPCLPNVASFAGPGFGGVPPYISGPTTIGDGGGGGGGSGCIGRDCWPPGCTKPDGSPCEIHDVSIKKTGATTPQWDAGTYSFSLTVTNNGGPFNAAPGVLSVTDAVPANMTIANPSVPGWTCNGPVTGPGNLVCTFNGGFVPAGTVTTVNLSGTAIGKPPFPPFTNCATVGFGNGAGVFDSNPDNNRDCVTIEKPEPKHDVKLEKTAGKVVPGPVMNTTTFVIAVTNVGAALNGANNITVTDIVPAGMTFTSAVGTNWNCLTLPATSGQTFTCTYIGTGLIASDATLGNITINANLSGNGPWENCADAALTASSGMTDADPTNNRSCVKILPPPKIDLAIEKKVRPGSSNSSSTVTFDLAVTNIGSGFAGANVIKVTDVAPAGMTFTSATGTNWNCTPATVPAGGTLTCTFTGTGPANPGDSLGVISIVATKSGTGPWVNCASVGPVNPTDFTDTNSANNQSCATVGFDTVDNPPPINNSCGVNVIFVVDESASVGANAWAVTSALQSAANVFNTNGSKAALIHFSDSAQLVQPMSTSTYSSITSGYSPSGGTNWEAGLKAALALLPSPNTVVIFITDGTPTAYLDNNNAIQFTTNSVLATNEAIPVVNQIYAQGVPIIGVGIGGLSTYLNALLGGNVHNSSFGGLNGTLSGLAKQACAGLYLNKGMSPQTINYHSNPGPHQTTISLTLQNTGPARTNVVIEDALPSELVNPTNFVSSVTATTPVSGNVIQWNIPNLPANSTATLTFKVTINPSPAPNANWRCIRNYTQVKSVDGTYGNGTANNMANAVTGPSTETDESYGQVCIADRIDVPPVCNDPQRLTVRKTIASEVCRPSVPGMPASGAPCTFNVTVRAGCAGFSGPVVFGENTYTSGGSAVSLPVASVTSSPAVSCTLTGNTPNICTANVNLAAWQTISFTVTLAAPIADGSYKNCFMADGQTPAPSGFSSSYPGSYSSPNGNFWGNCTNFIVSNSTLRVRPPEVLPPPPRITETCPPGMVRRGNECVPPVACAPPKVPGPVRGQCICPQGTTPRGASCIAIDLPKACPPSFIRTAANECVCPRGTEARGGRCVPQLVCRSPMVPNSRGNACICPAGLVSNGRTCIRPLSCEAPARLNRAGTACLCPAGTVARGNTCIVRERPRMECRPPARPNARGNACVCPQGMMPRGNACAPARLDPGRGFPQIQVVPGFGGPRGGPRDGGPRWPGGDGIGRPGVGRP
jgi:uncharacterized repeat protein (TIGR01451 family)